LTAGASPTVSRFVQGVDVDELVIMQPQGMSLEFLLPRNSCLRELFGVDRLKLLALNETDLGPKCV